MGKTIVLKSLSLKNFKGIKELTVNFDSVTNIYGDNGTGKSSIFDAFTWLLFDKDSSDRKNFEIKTLDKNNVVLHGLEHSITGVLAVDNNDIKLTKVYREKWTKRKGEAHRTLTGNETLYYVDELPVKQGEYIDKVNNLINENIFKLITNPLYFSMNTKWTDRRNILLEIIGTISDEAVMNSKDNLKKLEKLLVNKDIDTLKRSLAARKRGLNEEIKSIPYRIDELNNSLQTINFEEVEEELQQYSSLLKNIEDRLSLKKKEHHKFLNDKELLQNLKYKLNEREVQAKSEAQKPLIGLYGSLGNIEKEISKKENTLTNMSFTIERRESEIGAIEVQLKELTEEWHKKKKETLIISQEEFICPTCLRSFEAAEIESKRIHMQENFEKKRAKELYDLSLKQQKYRNLLEELQVEVELIRKQSIAISEQLKEAVQERSQLLEKIESFNAIINFGGDEEYMALKQQVDNLEEALEKAPAVLKEIENLKEQRLNLKVLIEEDRKKLLIKEQNCRINKRIQELIAEENVLAQRIAELENQELLCEEFIKTKVELLESRINSKFKFVRFKLFNTLVNGAVEECCEALLEGVPFSGANKAGQINGGLDIINALCRHYGVSAPIFIDNRESINRIISCSSQLINLIVSEDAELRIEKRK